MGAEKDTSALSPDEAIRKALDAERQADQRVAQCRQQAEEILEQARAQARRIADRANERIAFVHRRCTHRTAQAVDELLRENAFKQRGRRDTEAYGHEALQAAVTALAAELTGSTDEEE